MKQQFLIHKLTNLFGVKACITQKLRVLSTVLLLLYTGIAHSSERLTVSSPNKKITLEFLLENGIPKYRLLNQTDEVISFSRLGFKFKKHKSLVDQLELKGVNRSKQNENWLPVWGESKEINNHYEELVVFMQEKSSLKRKITFVFRVFDDGVGFRYEIPKQPQLNTFSIVDEITEFNVASDAMAWWTPADFDSYESLYQQSSLSKMPSVNTPLTLRLNNHTFVSIHEAALTDYAGMTLAKSGHGSLGLTSELVPWPDGIKVRAKTPFKSPWRTIQIADSAGGLIESDLIVNLNEPNVVEDTSWIKPMKYIGIWWGMHMREYTWEAGPKHGATTENTMRYIDFAKQNGIGGVLVEGWNKGWETWHSDLNLQDYTQAYDDFDLEKVVKYGNKHNVALIGHHETGGNIPVYEAQMEEAFKLYEDLGVHGIKTGYAGKMIPEGVYHHSQPMVNHYRKVVELAAKSKVMVNAHEPIKPTGIRRTFPNMMTREGGRGMEWNGWSEGNPPEHTVILPFTRLLAGPMDYTPGIFNLLFDPQHQYRVHTTLAKQLAMYVTLYSPMQMAADMIENYTEQPAFEFIKEVPTTWDESKVLNGEIGDYISMARRSDRRWFIGAMTDEQPRNLQIEFDFIENDVVYLARIFADGKTIDFYENPTALHINSVKIEKGDILNIALASGGGQALYLTPISEMNSTKAIKNTATLQQHNKQSLNNFDVFEKGRRFGEINEIQHLAVNKSIQVNTLYDQNYSGGGKSALIDGVMGGADYKTLWQGYRKKDLDVVIDLKTIQGVSSIEIGFLQSVLHSILLPSEVEFFVSQDGAKYTLLSRQTHLTKQTDPDYQQKRFTTAFEQQPIRYVKVRAKNIVNLPEWHVRAGQETFIFSDEIVVK